MKAFWQDGKRGVDANDAREMTRTRALDAWADLRGMRGNFFGLVDDAGRTLQLYFDAAIPDDVDDASHLRIVRAEIPVPERKGSLGAMVTIEEARHLIERVFVSGADPAAFPQFAFDAWHERLSGFVRRIKIFAGELSAADLLAESISDPIATSAGASKIWWGKISPQTPDDLESDFVGSDGRRRKATWIDAARCEIVAHADLPSHHAFLSATTIGNLLHMERG